MPLVPAEEFEGISERLLVYGGPKVGKSYLYREGRTREAWDLLEAVKTAVDPERLMNPGSLGLK